MAGSSAVRNRAEPTTAPPNPEARAVRSSASTGLTTRDNATQYIAKAGDIARENAVYRCEGCDRRMPVHSGVPIDDCPDCGSPSFQTGLASQPLAAEVALDGIG